MQILSIRGENIASLAQPFEIRLDEAPLSSAGLFAITGETGAGKSSLLDAMCLALYGNCPRLSGDGTRETVQDIDGQALRSNDPRMALRRGGARGLAEVTFRTTDGEIYVAGWQARRARGKIDGRLQSIERSLLRASDNQMLETQLTAVNEKVVELTGLTYDEFRRTVLLAQGDFAAFLEAKTDERAAILEKVTGTGIYREISRRIFDCHRRAEAALRTLQTRRGEHRLLTGEEREALVAEIKALRGEQRAASIALKGIVADIEAYQALQAAEARLTTAAGRVQRAETTIEALTGDRNWLAAWDSAQGLRGEVREVQGAKVTLEDARKELERLSGEHDRHKENVTKATTRFETAKADREKAEETFKNLAQVWTRATELDAQIVTARGEHETAAKILADLRKAEGKARAAHDGLLRQKSTLQGAIETRRKTLEGTPGHQALLLHWGAIEERIEARIEQVSRKAGSEIEMNRLADGISTDREHRKKIDTDIKSAEHGITAARKVQAEIKEERDLLQKAVPSARLERLGQAQVDVHALRQAGEAVRNADEALAGCRCRLETARKARTGHEDDANAAKARGEEAARLIETLRMPAEAATAAASREAEHLRQYLVDGEPCPVCQSTIHPVMEDGEIARLAEELRTGLTEAQKDRDTAQLALNKATTAISAADEIIAAETTNKPRLAAQVESCIKAFGQALEPLKGSPISDDLPEDPRAPEDRYKALLAKLAGWRAQLEHDRDRLTELDRIHRDAGEAIERASAEIVTFDGQKREIDDRILTTEKEISSLEQTAKSAGDAVAAIDRRLMPILEPTSERPDLFGKDGTERLEQLRQLVTALNETNARITEDREILTGLDTKIAQSEITLAGAQTAREGAEKVDETRRGTLEKLQDERKGLLGGEETGAHRTRHNDWRKAAQDEFDKAQGNLGTQNSILASLASSLKAAQDTETKAEKRVVDAESALESVCRAAGLDYEKVIELHATGEQTVKSCRDRLKAADTEKANADGARKERQEEYETLKRKGLPETPKEELEAERKRIEETKTEGGEKLGRLAERLDADAKTREALSGLEAEIEAAQKTLDTWAAVNDAVGSAKGDRFAQIAQAVTLALLVERANLHLDDLKPRYQLRVASSDLALHVIDRDMAGDARPTRLLSGGESFLVSLALALALSGMGSRGALAGTLFIDEGFGSLDSDSLDLAIDALERLQAQGRTIGVISHVQAMKDRIPVQLQVVKTGGGASEVSLRAW